MSFINQLNEFRSELTRARNEFTIPRSISLKFKDGKPTPCTSKEAEDLETKTIPMDEQIISSVKTACKIIDETTGLHSCSQSLKSSLGHPGNPEDPEHRHSIEKCSSVWYDFLANRQNQPTELQWSELRSVNFNNWRYSDADLLRFCRHMFLGPAIESNNNPELLQMSEFMALTKHCQIPTSKLDAWLCLIYRYYNRVPFHNFKHAFMVAQMMYATISIAKLYDYFPAQDLFILIFAALCHDLDHPGFTNSYQVNTQSALATRYNDQSPLENHHCAMAFILCRSFPAVNILSSFSVDEIFWIRRAVISCILSTDMSKHANLLHEFKLRIPEFFQAAHSTTGSIHSSEKSTLGFMVPSKSNSSADGEQLYLDDLEAVFDINAPESVLGIQRLLGRNLELRLMLMGILLKVCDISNEIRDLQVSGPWLDCLLKEFFHQAEVERASDLPVAPFMDPKLVTKCNSQIGFIRSSLIPLVDELTKLFPTLRKPLLNGAERQLAHYQSLTNSSNNNNTSSCTQSDPMPIQNTTQSSRSVRFSPDHSLDITSTSPLTTHLSQTRFLAEFLLHSDLDKNNFWLSQNLIYPRQLSQSYEPKNTCSSIPNKHVSNLLVGSLPNQLSNQLPFNCFATAKRPMRSSASDVPSSTYVQLHALRSNTQDVNVEFSETCESLETNRAQVSDVIVQQRRNSTSRLLLHSSNRLRQQIKIPLDSKDFTEILMKYQTTYAQQPCINQSQTLSNQSGPQKSISVNPLFTLITSPSIPATSVSQIDDDRSRKSSTGSMILAS